MAGFSSFWVHPRKYPPPLLRLPSLVAALPLSLVLLETVLTSSQLADVAGSFESLIQLPRCEDDDDGGDRGGRLGLKRVITVDHFGAVGDGLHDDTSAFLHAWQTACSLRYQSILKVPSRKNYLVGPINFTGPCCSNLTLLIMGTIVAPNDPDIWHNLDPHKWLYFRGINHLSIRGGGIINGMGERWWARSCKVKKTNPCRHAPTAITFHKCKSLRLQNLMLVNSQQMHIAFTDCIMVKASGLKVIAPVDSPNTDGIHISASDYVNIKDSEIKTGDDCISIVSDSSKVRIKDIKCGPGHGISIGSLGKSNSWSSVSDIHVSRVTFSNTENGFRIKTWQGGRGFARKISFQNAVMINVSNPIIIDQYYCDSFLPCPNQTSAVKVGEVSFNGVKGTSATENAMIFACSDSFPCEKIFLKNIQLSLHSGRQAAAYCWKARGFASGFVNPPPCLQTYGDFNKHKFHSGGRLWSISNWIGTIFNPRNWLISL